MKVKIKRLIALMIDCLVIFFVSTIPFYYLYKIFETTVINILTGTIAIIILFNLFLRKDCMMGYESIGKKIMNLKIYQDGKRVNNKKLLMDRIFHSFWTFSLYPFMILLKNQSIGDKKLNTKVKQ